MDSCAYCGARTEDVVGLVYGQRGEQKNDNICMSCYEKYRDDKCGCFRTLLDKCCVVCSKRVVAYESVVHMFRLDTRNVKVPFFIALTCSDFCYEFYYRNFLRECKTKVGTWCFYCKVKGVGLKKCSRCKFAFYCDEKCQRADWPRHKEECVHRKF